MARLTRTSRELITSALRKVNSILPRIADMPPQFPVDEQECRLAEKNARLAEAELRCANARAEGQREHDNFQMYRSCDKIDGYFPKNHNATAAKQYHNHL